MAIVGSNRTLLSGRIRPQVAQFLARTSGLDSAHRNAYISLINGLIVLGIWQKLDLLYIFAAPNSATALQNLIKNSFNGTANGTPSFTSYQGFTGVDASTTVYIDTGFNPSTAGGNYVQNSAHISAWSNTNAASSPTGGVLLGVLSGGVETDILPRYNGSTDIYFRINDSVGSASSATNASSIGHYISNRSGASATQGYKNGISVATPNASSGALANGNIFVLATDSVGVGATLGGGYQLTMASVGGNLSATDSLNFYNLLRTYMTAVGVP